MTERRRHILTLATQIVVAQVGNNDVDTAAISTLIRSVYNTLADVGQTAPGSPNGIEHAQNGHDHHAHDHDEPHSTNGHNLYVHPTHGQTVFGDRLICMEDGLSMKMLKRHLITVHGMTPEQYRAKWGLPDDYPMVASSYAKLRSSLALQSGLGLKPSARAGIQQPVRQDAAHQDTNT